MNASFLTNSFAESLACSSCNKQYSLFEVNTFATCCNSPLLVNYHLENTWTPKNLVERENNIWRYAEMLPLFNKENIISLGEGMTPLIRLKRLGEKFGFPNLYLKDESNNPTGSFKARGLSMAISKAKELGITNCIIPTAGNAGGAMAAYCAKAEIKATVVMPQHTPTIFKQECEIYGAELVLVNGLINDCAKKASELNSNNQYFDISTLKEPYRLEGKKTMGYEIAEQLDWNLPDVIIYPAGGGTGLIGIWKAFQELKSMGWIKGNFPRMIAVQSKNCAPISAAYKDPVNWKTQFTAYPTIANGLAVPYPFGMNLMLSVLKASNGCTVTLDEAEILSNVHEFAKTEARLLSPEGAATFGALLALERDGLVDANENLLLLNTGNGYKYLDNFNLDF